MEHRRGSVECRGEDAGERAVSMELRGPWKRSSSTDSGCCRGVRTSERHRACSGGLRGPWNTAGQRAAVRHAARGNQAATGSAGRKGFHSPACCVRRSATASSARMRADPEVGGDHLDVLDVGARREHHVLWRHDPVETGPDHRRWHRHRSGTGLAVGDVGEEVAVVVALARAPQPVDERVWHVGDARRAAERDHAACAIGVAACQSARETPPRLQPTRLTGARRHRRCPAAALQPLHQRTGRAVIGPCRQPWARQPTAWIVARRLSVVMSLAVKPGSTSAVAVATAPPAAAGEPTDHARRRWPAPGSAPPRPGLGTPSTAVGCIGQLVSGPGELVGDV